MIQEFRVRNYKNFRDELVFSLKTLKNYEFNKEIIDDSLIKGGMVIGANASGKTNLGYAMLDIIWHLTDKGRKDFRWSPNYFNSDDTVYFEYTFRFEQSLVVYSYEKKQIDKVIREQLTIDGRKVIVNDCDKRQVTLKGTENLNLENYDNDISLVRYVYANTILDKTEKDCKVFRQFIQFVNGMLWFSSTEGNRYIGFSNEQGNLFEAIANRIDDVKKLQIFLQELGINYQLVVRDNGEAKNIYCQMGEREILLQSIISSGTRSLIFFFFWYMQVENVTFLYIDEFDAFYHTDLSIEVIRKVMEIANTQAIITSHNTDLLSCGLLRPDCIFKLEDNKIKALSELTDKALREAHNLQKMYKAGAFND
ncbi:MAG: ATP-binding protein [Lachnospiraceae bacterium]|nr:ATP-binding protein [Lachnospiraceae bacterium]